MLLILLQDLPRSKATHIHRMNFFIKQMADSGATEDDHEVLELSILRDPMQNSSQSVSDFYQDYPDRHLVCAEDVCWPRGRYHLIIVFFLEKKKKTFFQGELQDISVLIAIFCEHFQRAENLYSK